MSLSLYTSTASCSDMSACCEESEWVSSLSDMRPTMVVSSANFHDGVCGVDGRTVTGEESEEGWAEHAALWCACAQDQCRGCVVPDSHHQWHSNEGSPRIKPLLSGLFDHMLGRLEVAAPWRTCVPTKWMAHRRRSDTEAARERKRLPGGKEEEGGVEVDVERMRMKAAGGDSIPPPVPGL
ncbi:hypothetical protein L3Q82_005454 [Scortum barcoo]|uniref:Uncharacterized protein n=1 Tax=Scortum barcoo TaxID=214431 RepID=A0ACB8VA22_9TELE|nr:hypothetical protein L3Q82_005454 [Scortum barcoo]